MKTAQYLLEMYQFGLARSAKDIPALLEISSGVVLRRYPEYWCSKIHVCDCANGCCRKTNENSTTTTE